MPSTICQDLTDRVGGLSGNENEMRHWAEHVDTTHMQNLIYERDDGCGAGHHRAASALPAIVSLANLLTTFFI